MLSSGHVLLEWIISVPAFTDEDAVNDFRCKSTVCSTSPGNCFYRLRKLGIRPPSFISGDKVFHSFFILERLEYIDIRRPAAALVLLGGASLQSTLRRGAIDLKLPSPATLWKATGSSQVADIAAASYRKKEWPSCIDRHPNFFGR